MKAVIGDWVGKPISITLRVGGIAGSVKIEGRLAQVDPSGVLLDMPKGQTFVPVTSILHLSLLNER